MKPSAYLILAAALGGLALASFASDHDTVAIFSAAAAFVMAVRWKQTAGPAKEMSEQQRRNAELYNLITQRFPSEVFWPAPEIMMRMQIYGDIDSKYYSEDLERWRHIKNEYPLPPDDDDDRQMREIRFWIKYAIMFSKEGADGRRVLKPKHIALDYYRDNDKWILREYCAATGEIIDPIIKSHSALFYDLLVKESKRYASNYYYELATQAEFAALRHFERETVPAHYNKWGEWFFHHIEKYFRQIHSMEAGPDDRSTNGQRPMPDDDEMRHRPVR